MNNQGGNMFIDALILLLVLGCLAALYMVRTQARSPHQLSLDNSASIRDMGTHLSEIDVAIKDIDSKIDELETDLNDVDQYAKANKAEIDALKSADSKLSDRIERLEAITAAMSERVQAMPREMSVRMQEIKESIPVEIRNAKFVSKSWIDYEKREVTGRNGKRIEKMVPVRKQLMKSVEPRVKKSKFQMPGVKAAKDQIVEAGL